MAISREEQLRNNRRFSRQIVGVVAIVLIIIGLFTVLSWVVGVLRSALDDTERRQSYADRLYGLDNCILHTGLTVAAHHAFYMQSLFHGHILLDGTLFILNRCGLREGSGQGRSVFQRVVVFGQFIEHIQCHHHPDIHIDELSSQEQVPFQTRSIHDIQH